LKLIDSHCHAHDDPKSLHLLKSVKAMKLFLMGTSPKDWVTLQNLTPTEKIHIGFGIHPWHASGIIKNAQPGSNNNQNTPTTSDNDPANTTTTTNTNNNNDDTKSEADNSNKSDENNNNTNKNTKTKKNTVQVLPEYTPININENETLVLLRKYLVDNPKSFIGEIGVDRVIIRRGGNPCPLNEQWALFDAQINLACELNRPVSVHCVDVFGAMFEYFQARTEMPPMIALHSFGGSSDVVKRYLKIPKFGNRFFFGFSYAINSRSNKLSETISKVPLDRILLESDLPDPKFIDENLLDMCKIVSKAHDLPRDQIADQTTKNALQFLGHLTS